MRPVLYMRRVWGHLGRNGTRHWRSLMQWRRLSSHWALLVERRSSCVGCRLPILSGVVLLVNIRHTTRHTWCPVGLLSRSVGLHMLLLLLLLLLLACLDH